MTSVFSARNASSVRFGACRAGAGSVFWNRVSNIEAAHAVVRMICSVYVTKCYMQVVVVVWCEGF